MCNRFLVKSKTFFSHPLFSDYRVLFGLWMLLAVLSAVTKMHRNNNFLIFRGVFWHTWDKLSLYAPYPAEYADVNHYGPLFSLVIAPFAVVPVWVGMVLWCLLLTLSLYWAIRHSYLSKYQQVFILWFCAHELLTALFMQQFNIAIAAILLIAFFCIEREKDFWAAFLIMLGTFVKLYGIVGLAFFFFSRHKGRLLASCAFWAAVMFVAPMLISSPEYIIGQYQAWFESLVAKNADNMFSHGTNISLVGMIRKISGSSAYSDLWVMIPGLIAFLLPYLRINQYRYEAYRQTILASVLMFLILFSTGSENSTYIIAVVGVAIWYTAAPWKRGWADVALMVYVFFFCTMAHSDLMPRFIREEYMKPYGLKALPVAIVWLKLCYELYTRDYSRAEKQ